MIKILHLRYFYILFLGIVCVDVSTGLSSIFIDKENIDTPSLSPQKKKEESESVDKRYRIFIDIYSYCLEHKKSFNLNRLVNSLNNLNDEYYFKKNIRNLGLPEELFFEPLWQCFRQERIINYQRLLNFISDNLPDVIIKKEETLASEATPLLKNYFSFLTYDNLYKRK